MNPSRFFPFVFLSLVTGRTAGQNATLSFSNYGILQEPIIATFPNLDAGCSELASSETSRLDLNDPVILVDCVELFEFPNCQGRSQKLTTETDSTVRLTHTPKSLQLCSSSSPEPEDLRNTSFAERNKHTYNGLDLHNRYRNWHRVSNMKLNQKVTKSAQDYADYLAATGKFEHSKNSGFGENLAYCHASDRSEAVKKATKMWYDEERKYDYNNPGFTKETGHFTQVVWKSSNELGVGVQYDKKRNAYMIVAQYKPPGNYKGQFRQNVFRRQ